MENIAFIGAGKIAQAFIQGLANAKWKLFAYDPAQEALKIAEKLGATAAKDSFTAVKKAETVIVCTKPEKILNVLDELSDCLDEKLVISVAAGVSTQKIFSALNCRTSKILKKVRFTHPYYDQIALDTQHELSKLQNQKDLLFCGSYFGYGFHEDGIKSSIEMLKNLND